ncbi:MAG: hypothetical protein IT370_24215 [Deltaproteobacteria bacterium]|nr:hypothetical protein [Deltaproteobacteria bacterium]
MSSQLPFPFYGAAPADWESGFPPYLVTFVAEPNADERAALEARITEAMKAAGVGLGDRIKWDGSTMLLVFDERVPDWDQFFEDVATTLAAAHEHCPITQAIFLNAEPGDGDPAGPPAAGPRFGFVCPFD